MLRALTFVFAISCLAWLHAADDGPSAIAASATSWPLARGDQQGTGVTKATLPEKPEVLWKFEVKGTSFESVPAIVDGVVYFGDMDAKLYALKLSDGSKMWEFPGTLGFPGSPAVRDGKVYVGDGDGVFHCLNAKDGSEIWKVTTDSEIVAGANFWKDKVLIGSQDSRLYCLDAATGKEAWKLQIGNQIRAFSTVVEDRSFVAQCDGTLHIVNMNDGTIVASVALEQPNQTSAPAVLGDKLYFGTEEGALMCIDWKKAEIAWQVADKSRSQPFHSSPALLPDMLVLGSVSKRVQAFSPVDGKELWSFATKNKVESSPVIVGGRVLIGAADGRLYLLDRQTGKETWQFECHGPIDAGAAVADDRFVVGTKRGVVYCFGKK